MSDEEDSPPNWLRERMSILVGVVGLLGWFAMLWFMFGDVL